MVPGDGESFPNHPDVGAVVTIDPVPRANVPMASRPGVVSCGERHPDQGLPRDLPDEVGIAGFCVMVGSAHELPIDCTGVAMQQH